MASRGDPRERAGREPWLLLVLQLPAHPVSVRVKTWRRLQQLGAVAVKNAVYALPNRAETREDFEWVRREVVAGGGQATVFQASTVDNLSNDELRESFRRLRTEDYRMLARSIDKAARSHSRPGPRDARTLAKAVRAARDRLTEIEVADYFAADGRQQARVALERLETLASQAASRAALRADPSVETSPTTLDVAAFQKRRWLTRPRPGIDRMASAWLIRRFIDPHAVFLFGDVTDTRPRNVVTFDMFGGDFTHHGEHCTFETLCARFALADDRLREIAELVHDLDLKDGRYGRPESPLLGRLVEGLRALHEDDATLLEQGIAMFDALYHGQVTPPARTPKKSSRARRKR
jgi:hypothetical protein